MVSAMKTWVILIVLLVVLALATSGAILGFGNRSDPERDTPVSSLPGDPRPSPTSDGNTLKQAAQITGTAIIVGESYPPQYFLQVEYGLQNSCTKPGGYEVNKSGDMVTVTVYVTRPASTDIVCAQIYRTESYNIPVGSDFDSEKAYRVVVNGQATSFIAQ